MKLWFDHLFLVPIEVIFGNEFFFSSSLQLVRLEKRGPTESAKPDRSPGEVGLVKILLGERSFAPVKRVEEDVVKLDNDWP